MTVLREKQSNDNLAQAYNEGEQHAMSSNAGYDAEAMEDPYNPLYYNRSPHYGQEEVNPSTMTASQLRHNYPSSETISVKLDSPMVEHTRKNSPTTENMPEDSSIVEDTHNESPMVDDTCKDSLIAEDMPKDSPIAEDTRKDSPIAEDMREDSPLVEDALQNLKIPEDTRKESPFVQDMHEVSLAEDTRKDLPIVMVNSLIVEDVPPVAEDMREQLPIVGTPKGSPVAEAMPTASPIAKHVSPLTKNTSPIAQGSSTTAQYTRKVPTTFEEILPAHKILTWEELDEQEKQKRKNRSISGIVALHAQKFGGQIKRFTERQKSKQY